MVKSKKQFIEPIVLSSERPPPPAMSQQNITVNIEILGFDKYDTLCIRVDTAENKKHVQHVTSNIVTESKTCKSKLVIGFETLKRGTVFLQKKAPRPGFGDYYMRVVVEEIGDSVWVSDLDRPHNYYEIEKAKFQNENSYFDLSASITAQKEPALAIRCNISGLELFSGSTIRKAAATLGLERLKFEGELMCPGKVDQLLPLFKIKTRDESKRDLTNMILEKIPEVCALPPFSKSDFINEASNKRIKIAHIDRDGTIWFQFQNETLDLIINLEDAFDIVNLMDQFASFKADYFELAMNRDAVFAAPRNDGKYGRVKVIEVVGKIASVVFIDYGDKSQVSTDSIFMLELVNKAYRYIPSQVFQKFKLRGITEVDPIAVRRVRTLLDTHEIKIKLGNKYSQNDETEVDVFLKTKSKGEEEKSLVGLLQKQQKLVDFHNNFNFANVCKDVVDSRREKDIPYTNRFSSHVEKVVLKPLNGLKFKQMNDIPVQAVKNKQDHVLQPVVSRPISPAPSTNSKRRSFFKFSK